MDVGEPPRGEQLRMPWCGCSATDLQLRQTRCEPCPVVHIQVRTLLIRTLLVPIRTLLLRPKSKVGLKGPVHGERIDSPARGACGRACRLASRAGCMPGLYACIRTPHSTDSDASPSVREPIAIHYTCVCPPGVFERFTGTVPVFTGCEVLLCDP